MQLLKSSTTLSEDWCFCVVHIIRLSDDCMLLGAPAIASGTLDRCWSCGLLHPLRNRNLEESARSFPRTRNPLIRRKMQARPLTRLLRRGALCFVGYYRLFFIVLRISSCSQETASDISQHRIMSASMHRHVALQVVGCRLSGMLKSWHLPANPN